MTRILNTTAAALLATCILGCSVMTPRYTSQQAAALTDREICLVGLETTSLDADSAMLLNEYNQRLQSRRFTHEQCMALQARQRAANQAESVAVDNAALGGLAFQLGQAIGSRGRVVSTYRPTASPTYAPNCAPIAPAQPYAPVTPPAPYAPRLMGTYPPTPAPSAPGKPFVPAPLVPYTPPPLLLMSSTLNSSATNAMIICTYGPYGSTQRTLFVPAPGTCPNSLPQ